MSDLRRFFVPSVTSQTIIDGEEFYHAVNVLRIKIGDEVILCDNTGDEYIATIVSIAKKELIANVTSKSSSDKETKNFVTLICGYLKGDKTELVVQKATELGVKKIVVFSSKFSSAFMNENKLLRLKRVALESAKQCGRAIVPQVEYAENIKKALEQGDSAKHKLFACEFATSNEVEFNQLNDSTAIVVGSEGGFSEDEWQTALDKGYKTVYLGKRILRADTASIVLCGIVMHALKELE